MSSGFESVLGDPCLFSKILPHGSRMYVCCYIDDITYGVPDDATADLFLATLRERFVIEEGEGKPIDWLLNMSVVQDLAGGTVHINQELAITKLAQGLLTPEELTRAKGVRYPMLTTPLLRQEERTVPVEHFDYLSIIGSLLHIANCTRCDVALCVGILARHAACPGPAHVKAAKRVVMYLFNTRHLGITYFRDCPAVGSPPVAVNVPCIYEGAKHPLDDGTNRVQLFADSDYASDETKRSTMGSVTVLNSGPICWSSVLGKTVATSTCEAEINAACAAVKDALHIKRMLFDLGVATAGPFQIAEDNAACIAQATSGLRHVRNAKHYEVKLRFLQQLVVDKDVEFVYCPTDVQLADLFTKPLEVDKFIFFRNALLRPAPLRQVAE